MPVKKLRLPTIILLLAGTGPALSGCGTINVQASGGGAEGFASLGAIIMGTTALRYLRGSDRDTRHEEPIQRPPDTTQNPHKDPGEPDSRTVD